MKKILSALVLIGFLAVLVIPLAVSAQKPPQDCCKLNRNINLGDKDDPCEKGNVVVGPGGTCDIVGKKCDRENWGMYCLMNTLYGVTDWIFIVLVGLSGIFVVLGALNLLMSGGDAEKIKTGRQYIIYAIVGLVVGFLARAIPSLVQMLVGM